MTPMEVYEGIKERRMDLDLATVDRLLSTTRAVRKRLDLTRPVPAAVIIECVRLATQAPSADDAQNWRWVVLTDQEKRDAIGEIYRAESDEYVRDQAARQLEGAARRKRDSVLYLIEHLREAPVHVLAYVVDPELEGMEGQQLPAVLLYGSIFPAVWSFQLALRSRGLGPTPLFCANEAAVAEVVGAPEGAHLASVLPVAYYTGESFKPAARRPVEDVLFWNGWGAAGGSGS